MSCKAGGTVTAGRTGKVTMVPGSPGDDGLRTQALLNQVLPRWAGRYGTECVNNWNNSVGKGVNMTANANSSVLTASQALVLRMSRPE